MTKVAKIFLAEGFEETEALVPYDILRRGGVNVSLVSVSGSENVQGAHGVPIGVHEALTEAAAEADLLMLPGGTPGTFNLGASETLCGIIAKAAKSGKVIAAICAAPSVIGKMGLLNGRKATCYPGFEDKLTGARCVGENVVKDGNFITGIGPGASFEFGFAVLAELEGEAVVRRVKEQMILR